MNDDIFFWKLKQVIWDVKQQWSKLTDEDFAEISNKDQLVWKIQEKYGYAKEDAMKKVDEFVKKFK